MSKRIFVVLSVYANHWVRLFLLPNKLDRFNKQHKIILHSKRDSLTR